MHKPQHAITIVITVVLKASVATWTVVSALDKALGQLLGVFLGQIGLPMTDCNAGGCILRQGKLGRSMYFVRSGFVDLVMDGAVVDTIQAGDYFGEVALLSLPPTHELLKVPPVLPSAPPPRPPKHAGFPFQ